MTSPGVHLLRCVKFALLDSLAEIIGAVIVAALLWNAEGYEVPKGLLVLGCIAIVVKLVVRFVHNLSHLPR